MQSFILAIQFLTILPAPGTDTTPTPAILRRSVLFYPLVGLVIGAVAAAVCGLAAMILPGFPASVITVIAMITISGGLHMDGLADTADGFFSARPRDQMMRIMKDSRVGVMGLIAVVCVILLKVSVLASLPPAWRWRTAFLMPLDEKRSFAVDWKQLGNTVAANGDIVYLGQPNNPTGQIFDTEEFGRFAASRTDVFFVVDESFADFVSGYASIMKRCQELRNVLVLRSMTKFYAVPGLRVGFAAVAPETAELIRQKLAPWSVNSFAQAFGTRALNDDAYADASREKTCKWRDGLYRALADLPGVKLYPGAANFILGRFTGGRHNAAGVARQLLLKHHIAIRICDNFAGLDETYFRTAVRTPAENQRLIGGLEEVLTHKQNRRPRQKKTGCYVPGHILERGQERVNRRPVPGNATRRHPGGAVQSAKHVAQLFRHQGWRRNGTRPGYAGAGLLSGAGCAHEPCFAETRQRYRRPGDAARQTGRDYECAGLPRV